MVNYRKDIDELKPDLSSLSEIYSNIVITGLTGCGKTKVGKDLAQYIGWGFIDTDEQIQKMNGMNPREIISSKGLEYFRVCEFKVINSLSFIKNHVITLGSGTICDKRNRVKIRQMGLVIWLDVSPLIIARRFLQDPSELIKRPLLANKSAGKELPSYADLLRRLESLLEERLSYYKNAHLVISDDYSSTEICVQKVYTLILGS